MSAPPPVLAPGALIGGRYRIRRSLGMGGMGMVFEATHVRLNQPVALKLLRPELAMQPEFVARFEREARAAAALRSPYVVRTFDVDTTSDGVTFLVMELLSGNDLAAELESASVPDASLVDWTIQCCAALEEARKLGIVHRDLKPANIFLADEPPHRTAKILDFGISKILEDTTMDGAPRTRGSLGTPQYMSPEQIRSSKDIDHRSDVWALGVVLYRALSGRSPFESRSESDLLVAIVTEPAIPLGALRPDLPDGLCAAVMRALEKSPDDRHATALAFGEELAPFGTGRTSALTGVTGPTRGRKRASAPDAATKRPGGAAAAAPVEDASATAAVVGAGVALGTSPRPNDDMTSRGWPRTSMVLFVLLIAGLGVAGFKLGGMRRHAAEPPEATVSDAPPRSPAAPVVERKLDAPLPPASVAPSAAATAAPTPTAPTTSARAHGAPHGAPHDARSAGTASGRLPAAAPSASATPRVGLEREFR